VSRSAYLGFDYGEKTIGVAVGSTESGSAQTLDAVHVGKKGPDWNQIARLIEEWQPQGLVVGLPLNMDGTENEMTQIARKFGNRLNGRFHLPVHWADERLTTIEARQRLLDSGLKLFCHNKPKIDKLAAQAILQAWLNETENK
jgi:putative Holliday junction resolvase